MNGAKSMAYPRELAGPARISLRCELRSEIRFKGGGASRARLAGCVRGVIYTLVMTTTKEALLTDLEYSAWADQVLLDACSRPTAEEIARDLGASHHSVIETLRHIYYTERVWAQRLRENAMPRMHEVGDQRLFCDPPPEPGLTELQRDWPEGVEG